MKLLSGVRGRIFLAGVLLSLAASPARAEEGPKPPDYESSEEFEKSKEAFGQPREEEKPAVDIRLYDREPDERPPGLPTRFGGGGGPLVSYLSLDLSGLDPMTHDRGLDRFDSNMLLIGGLGGFSYHPPDSPGWWFIGGMGFGVEQSVSDRIEGDHRRAKLTLGGGGVFCEYHHPVTSRLDLALGAMMGAGSITLTAKGDDLGIDSGDWSASETFFIGYPYAGLGYQPLPWLRLELAAGWMFMTAGLKGSDFVVKDSNLKMTDSGIDGGFQLMVKAVFGLRPEMTPQGRR